MLSETKRKWHCTVGCQREVLLGLSRRKRCKKTVTHNSV